MTMVRVAWCAVIAWAILPLGGVLYFAWAWLTDIGNPARQEFLIGVTLSAVWLWPGVLVATLLTSWHFARADVRFCRLAWAALGAVVALAIVIVGAGVVIGSVPR